MSRKTKYRFYPIPFLLAFLVLTICTTAQVPNKDSLKKAITDELKRDSVSNNDEGDEKEGELDIMRKIPWQVNTWLKNGKTNTVISSNPDTIGIREVTRMTLSADIKVPVRWRGKPLAIIYDYMSAACFTTDGDTLLATGKFNSKKDDKLKGCEQYGYVHLPVKDTVVHLTIDVVPDSRLYFLRLNLKLAEQKTAEQNMEQYLLKNQEDYSLGYYYLSFGIVFMLVFLFSRDKTENLYFSLFCLSTSFSCLSSASYKMSDIVLFLFFMVFSFEFMSFFMAKVFKNKNKSKISLFIRLIVSAVCFHPAVLYNYSVFEQFVEGNVGKVTMPLTVLGIFIVLFCISFFSSVIYLLKGFRQKRWEARTIVYVCCLALFISIGLPIISSMLPGDTQFLNDFAGVGIYVYPLSAVIVLGRTNRLNQMKLLDQVNSIRQLSEQNLTKEREKQQLLETQNIELENKVLERTSDIIKQKEELEIKKQEIETKNKAITDNINYAQRIQSAILPDIKRITNSLPHSFILFQPKDIVSGDFYVFAEKNDRVIIIAGDCTGHGVSGAFMSMIGSSLLNQIINEKGIVQPDLILNQLNSAVIEALKQSENESHDGMDIAICSFDLKNNELQFAGANRPLWLLRNGTLEVFKPDKFPIGGLQMAKNRTFTNTTIALTPKDTVYIFTDGYADQFGGTMGKKLMTAKFKELLLSIQELDMKEQNTFLNKYFEKWRGSYEQVDDVLLIGVRV